MTSLKQSVESSYHDATRTPPRQCFCFPKKKKKARWKWDKRRKAIPKAPCNCDTKTGYKKTDCSNKTSGAAVACTSSSSDNKHRCWESSQTKTLTWACISTCATKTAWRDAPCAGTTKGKSVQKKRSKASKSMHEKRKEMLRKRSIRLAGDTACAEKKQDNVRFCAARQEYDLNCRWRQLVPSQSDFIAFLLAACIALHRGTRTVRRML